jgi:hypothetical protein
MTDTMNALIVSVPVLATSPNVLLSNQSIELPWWVTTPPEDLYVHCKNIPDGGDVFNAVAMGLTVQPHAETSTLFVSPLIHREKASINHTLTKDGYVRYKRECIGETGWPMLKLFCDFAQSTQGQVSTDTNGNLVKLLDARVVDQLEMMLFNKFDAGKRWRDGEKMNKTLRLRWRESQENAYIFERLARPLLPPGEFSGTNTDALKVFDILNKVKQGVFETSGKVCNYNWAAHHSKYQNEKKKGEGVVFPTLNNAWALFLTAGLKLRVTIWSRTEGHDGVQVMNNDAIIQDIWARDLIENPNIIHNFDQVLMCRPKDGILRAVQRYHSEWPASHWSKLMLVDSDLIPADYQSQSEEVEDPAPSIEEVEETESIDDEQHHVMWKKQQAQDMFDVTIGPGEILRFVDNISAQLTFHIRDQIYFNTSTHASIAIHIAGSQMQQLSIDMKDFAARVTKPEYWDDKSIPTGYQIMQQVRHRIHVVWFVPRLETPHILSFLQVDLTIWPNSMNGLLFVTHVTENRQVLFTDQKYKVIALDNIATFKIMLLELHKSDYLFLRRQSIRDCPDKQTVDTRILKFKIPHPVVNASTTDAKFKRVISGQIDSIIEAISVFASKTKLSGLAFDETDVTDNYVYSFNSKSKKRMRLTINVQYDGPYTEIELEQLVGWHESALRGGTKVGRKSDPQGRALGTEAQSRSPPW